MEVLDFVRNKLVQLQDATYRDFHKKLIPNVNQDLILGVRVPLLRKLAKEFETHADVGIFLGALPHTYYEENNLHAFLIENISSYNKCIAELKRFLPYVDNWATCDSMRPKCFGKNRNKLLHEIKCWLASDHEYTIRFGIEMLMVWYLDDDFDAQHLEMVATISSDAYYVRMMQAWYFATALVKQYDAAIGYIIGSKLPLWVHNKTIQKALESDRISKEQKNRLRILKRKM